MADPNFITWLWKSPEGNSTMYGAKKTFTPDHVNRMANMIRRHWPGFSGKILCVTDSPEGIQDDVEVVSLWDSLRQYGKCYCRLRAFDPAMAPILGDDIISIDLDAVIKGDIRPLFENDPEPFRIWRIGRESRSEMCGSLWRLKIGFAPGVYHDFNPDIALNLRKTHGLIGSDQAWMAYMLPTEKAGWGMRDGIYSFRFHLDSAGQMPFSGMKRKAFARSQASLPDMVERAKIVFFHGPDYDPSMTHLHVHHKWIPEYWR